MASSRKLLVLVRWKLFDGIIVPYEVVRSLVSPVRHDPSKVKRNGGGGSRKNMDAAETVRELIFSCFSPAEESKDPLAALLH